MDSSTERFFVKESESNLCRSSCLDEASLVCYVSLSFCKNTLISWQSSFSTISGFHLGGWGDTCPLLALACPPLRCDSLIINLNGSKFNLNA